MKFYHLVLFIFFTSASYSQSFIQNPFNGHRMGQPAIADMDNDGKVDALGYKIQNFDATTGDLQIFFNESDDAEIGFNPISLGVVGIGVPVIVDLDGDDDADILMSQWNGESAVVVALYNDGDLNFTIDTISVENYHLHKIADLDSDGDMDWISMNYDSNHVAVFINNGAEGFLQSSSWAIDNLLQCEISDFDGDGDMDIVAAILSDPTQFIIYDNDGNGEFTATQVIEGQLFYLTKFKILDFDDDGLDDIIYTGLFTGELSILTRSADGQFEEIIFFELFRDIQDFSVANFDGKHSKDIIVSEEDVGIKYFENLGEGLYSFDEPEYISGIYPAKFSPPVDVDNDGDLDIIFTNVFFWWMENIMDEMTTTTSIANKREIHVTNPVINTLIVHNIRTDDILDIYDVNGKFISRHLDMNSGIPMDHLKSGTYMIRVTNKAAGSVSTHTIIKL